MTPVRDDLCKHGPVRTPEPQEQAGPKPAGYVANASWLFVAEIIGKVASFVFLLFVARELGRRGYGTFSFAIAFADLFLMIGTLGLNTVLIREAARDREALSDIFRSAFWLRFPLGLIALAAAAIASLAVTDSPTALAAVLLLGGGLFVDDLTSLLGAVFRAFEQARLYAAAMLTNRIVSALLGIVVVLVTRDLVLVGIAYLTGSFAGLLVGIALVRGWWSPWQALKGRPTRVRYLLKEASVLAIAGALNMAIFRLDTVMLQVLRGAAEVGIYGVAYRFFDSFLFVSHGLATVALPRVARLGSSRGSAHNFQLTLALTLAFYIPLAIGSIAAGRWVIVGLFSERFAPAAAALPWLMGAAALYAVAYLARVSTIGLGGRSQLLWVAGAALAANVVLNLVLIPSRGATGAAVATFITEVFEAGATLLVFYRLNHSASGGRVLLVPVVAGAVMALALLPTGIEDLQAILVGAPTYAAALVVATLVLVPRTLLGELRKVLRPSEI